MPGKLPKDLQPVLWSVKLNDLGLKEDRIYIFHQILAFGNLKQLKWLFQDYSLKEIKEVFLKHPLKIYRSSSFNLVKEIFLRIRNKKLDEKKYITPPLQSLR